LPTNNNSNNNNNNKTEIYHLYYHCLFIYEYLNGIIEFIYEIDFGEQRRMSYSNRPLGPLGIDPLYFSLALFGCLLLFVIYLLLPRAVRVQYFDAYPKRYSWSAKPRRLRMVSECLYD
jgi:hypothetical protein